MIWLSWYEKWHRTIESGVIWTFNAMAVNHSDEHFSTVRFHSLTRSEFEARTLALARAKVEGESTPSSPSIRSWGKTVSIWCEMAQLLKIFFWVHIEYITTVIALICAKAPPDREGLKHFALLASPWAKVLQHQSHTGKEDKISFRVRYGALRCELADSATWCWRSCTIEGLMAGSLTRQLWIREVNTWSSFSSGGKGIWCLWSVIACNFIRGCLMSPKGIFPYVRL